NSWVLDDAGVVTITPGATSPDRINPSLIGFRRVRFFDRDMEEDTTIGQIDLKWERDEDSYLKAGVKYSGTDRVLDDGQRFFGPGTSALNLGTSSTFHKGGFINEVNSYNVPNIWMDID